MIKSVNSNKAVTFFPVNILHNHSNVAIIKDGKEVDRAVGMISKEVLSQMVK